MSPDCLDKNTKHYHDVGLSIDYEFQVPDGLKGKFGVMPARPQAL
jgi:hypothetical protein